MPNIFTVFEENVYTKEFVISQANGTRSYEQMDVVVPADEQILPATIMEVDAAGDIIALTSPTGDIAGILATPADSTRPSQTLLVRDAEVLGSALTYPDGATDADKATINEALRELGIFVRTGGVVVT